MSKPNTERQHYLRNEPHRVPLGYEEHAGDPQFATTLARGIELIRCFSANETTLSNAELSERTGLPRPTISRLTYTLVILGYLKPSAKYGKYQLGSALLSATYPLMASIGLRQHARGLMEKLADETGGEVSMGIRDRLNIVLVETSRSRKRGRTQATGPMADTGLSLPIAGTAIGRAWLAGCDEATRVAVLNEIRVKAPSDWERFEPAIQQALQDCAKQGFCAIEGDLLTDVQAVGAPYGRTPGGELIVFNCAFQNPVPQAEPGVDWLRKDVGPKLLAMVRLLREGRHS
ncbi:MAG: IclR family transcriptional regulator [Burkholderiaceae bacterium]|nr:IclR family transcriptional regulator [Burkholderiaceae bacterium]